MKHIFPCAAAMLLGSALYVANADEPAKSVVVTPVLSTSVTSSGQPITLPTDHATVVVSTYEIAKGATLPEHEHPYPRYGYVLSGEIRITNSETKQTKTYKAGDFILEAIGQWHHAENVGNGPVKLLVIDQVPNGAGNTVLQK